MECGQVKRMEMDTAFTYFISAKQGEGLRERTITDYKKTWGYFVEWMREAGRAVRYVDEITTAICREYVRYMAAPRYKGHKYIDSTEQTKGLADATM